MTPAERRVLRDGAAALGVALDDLAMARLGRFVDLLEVWNRRFRLTGDRDRPTLLHKHVLDSLAVVPELLELPLSGPALDIGSGAGFPGLILACACPDRAIVLVEPRRRPTSFLREAIRTVPLPNTRAVEARAEDAARDPTLASGMALVVSRALRLDTLLELSRPFLTSDGVLVAMQTPSLSEQDARERARPSGLTLLRLRDYRLPGGESRRLLVFGLTPGTR
jgi:16S rRNA (guanine527-N7)-methyltransferase